MPHGARIHRKRMIDAALAPLQAPVAELQAEPARMKKNSTRPAMPSSVSTVMFDGTLSDSLPGDRISVEYDVRFDGMKVMIPEPVRMSRTAQVFRDLTRLAGETTCR